MPKTRDLLYINSYPKVSKVLSYGLEFKEFMNCIEPKPENILILKGHYWGSEFGYTTRCEMCFKQDFEEFVKEEVYNYGDFCWIDFSSVDKLKSLEPLEVGELLYLGQLQRPVESPFFSKLDNQYVYLAHDDGWRNEIYYKDFNSFHVILGNLIALKLKTIHNKDVYLPDQDVINELIALSESGLAIDFDRILEDKEEDSFEVKIHILGKIQDMDQMYEDYERLKAKDITNKSLEYCCNKWYFRDWSD